MTAVPDLSARIADLTVAIGIPSYNEGRGIHDTLSSVEASAAALHLPRWHMIVSDSSETTSTVDAVHAWAHAHPDVTVVVDRSDVRRSLKEALNAIFDRCAADILIATNADIVVTSESFAWLLDALTSPRRPLIAVGCAAPDPAFHALRHRGSAWQLRATRRLASQLPDDARRAEGALWASWREFYSSYRFPIGTGALHDDVELMRHAERNDIPMANAWRAPAFKVPAGSLRDFSLQTTRWQQTASDHRREAGEARAAIIEAARDPFGAACYAFSRAWTAVGQRVAPIRHSEHWETEHTTKR